MKFFQSKRRSWFWLLEINDVLANGFFAIICDESSDISKTEQMPFSIRHCNDAYEVFEEFVGILPCDEGVASEALLKYVRDLLTRCCFPSRKMVGLIAVLISNHTNDPFCLQGHDHDHTMFRNVCLGQ